MAVLHIPTLEISVDMLKRFIQKDKHALRTLGLLESDNFNNMQIGNLMEDGPETGTFGAFRLTDSLKMVGLKEEDVIYCSCRVD